MAYEIISREARSSSNILKNSLNLSETVFGIPKEISLETSDISSTSPKLRSKYGFIRVFYPLFYLTIDNL